MLAWTYSSPWYKETYDKCSCVVTNLARAMTGTEIGVEQNYNYLLRHYIAYQEALTTNETHKSCQNN